MKSFPLALLAAAILAVAIPAAGQDVAAESPIVTISIENFTFSPETVTVAPGTTVTWVNHDDIPHVVVDTGKGFRSKALDTDDSYSFTFASPGSFEYFCALHPHMTGMVVVAQGAG